MSNTPINDLQKAIEQVKELNAKIQITPELLETLRKNNEQFNTAIEQLKEPNMFTKEQLAILKYGQVCSTVIMSEDFGVLNNKKFQDKIQAQMENDMRDYHHREQAKQTQTKQLFEKQTKDIVNAIKQIKK